MKRHSRKDSRVKSVDDEHTPDRQQKRQEKTGRVSSEFCRLCHGKFSPRRLRQVFAQLQGDSCNVYPLFCTDFQQLLGIPMNRDPNLSQFICNNCHAQFYKCHSILLDFRNRVNQMPFSKDKNNVSHLSKEDVCLFSSHITSDSRCLHRLVSWTHNHAESCHSCPDLYKVLESQCRGTLKVLWGCIDGHTYMMDTAASQHESNQTKPTNDSRQSASRHEENHTMRISNAALPQTHNTKDVQNCEKINDPVTATVMETHADCELSDRNCLSDDDDCEDVRKSGSSEESSDLSPDKCSTKENSKEHKILETKARRKPGPKPGWKKNIKAEREELPTIYKCPHQGCTAVYRGADGMKKHIKEHHEEVRERPCPHPGCNKVFMIDRYLQRHVKLIHTEVRNYICDQCGQTFKQRKHLSVHQMRHSGAKPLQCEVCGFQCRQRASLKYHMTKHKAEADLDFACAICGKRFEKAHNLNVHMSMVHPLMQGGNVSITPDVAVSKLSAPISNFTPDQTNLNPPDMNCVLDSFQSKVMDHTS